MSALKKSYNNKIIKTLERLAIEAPGTQGRFKLAAGIVRRNRLLATGVNSYKTHPLMMRFDYRDGQNFLHAEIDAIKNALRIMTQEELEKCDIYIVRVKHPDHGDDSWVHGIAKPCPGCANALATFNIKRTVFTTDNHGTVEVV